MLAEKRFHFLHGHSPFYIKKEFMTGMAQFVDTYMWKRFPKTCGQMKAFIAVEQEFQLKMRKQLVKVILYIV